MDALQKSLLALVAISLVAPIVQKVVDKVIE